MRDSWVRLKNCTQQQKDVIVVVAQNQASGITRKSSKRCQDNRALSVQCSMLSVSSGPLKISRPPSSFACENIAQSCQCVSSHAYGLANKWISLPIARLHKCFNVHPLCSVAAGFFKSGYFSFDVHLMLIEAKGSDSAGRHNCSTLRPERIKKQAAAFCHFQYLTQAIVLSDTRDFIWNNMMILRAVVMKDCMIEACFGT